MPRPNTLRPEAALLLVDEGFAALEAALEALEARLEAAEPSDDVTEAAEDAAPLLVAAPVRVPDSEVELGAVAEVPEPEVAEPEPEPELAET
jgi:hypothetical protein